MGPGEIHNSTPALGRLPSGRLPSGLGGETCVSLSPPPPPGTYLTEGKTLFHLQDVIANASGELFLELEDCASLDVFLYPARTLAALGMRAVTPKSL